LAFTSPAFFGIEVVDAGMLIRDTTVRPDSLSFTNKSVNHDFTGII
jgi:hypothetical protein